MTYREPGREMTADEQIEHEISLADALELWLHGVIAEYKSRNQPPARPSRMSPGERIAWITSILFTPNEHRVARIECEPSPRKRTHFLLLSHPSRPDLTLEFEDPVDDSFTGPQISPEWVTIVVAISDALDRWRGGP